MEEILTQLPGLLPVLIVVGITGITWAVNEATKEPPTPELPQGKARKHLVLLPLALGILAGIAHYYVTVDLVSYSEIPRWRHIVTALETGFGYGGAGVLLWELMRRYVLSRLKKAEAGS